MKTITSFFINHHKTFLAWAPILISILALWVSISQINLNIEYEKIKARPILSVAFTNEHDSSGFVLRSGGNGTAIIREIGVWVGGKPMRSWKEAADAVFPNGTFAELQLFTPSQNTPLLPGQEERIFWASSGNADNFLLSNSGKVQISICYCSIFWEIDKKQCWSADANLPDSFPNTCEKAPEVKFVPSSYD